MKNGMIFLLLIVFLGFVQPAMRAQSMESCWGFMDGNPIRLDLLVSNAKELTGNLQFLEISRNIPFKGRVMNDQSVTFYRKIGNEDKVAFQGSIEGGVWKGYWVEGGQVLPLMVRSEKYFNNVNRFFQETLIEAGLTPALVQLDSLFTRYWSRDKETEKEEIQVLGKEILNRMEHLLEQEESAVVDWEYLLGINVLESLEDNFKLVSWTANKQDIIRQQINLAQYRGYEGKLETKLLETGVTYSDIFTLFDGDEPLFLLKGISQTCPDCFVAVFNLLHIDKDMLESDYGGFQFTERDIQTGEKRKNYLSNFEISYQTGQLLDFSYDSEMMEIHYAFVQKFKDGEITSEFPDGKAALLIEGTLRAHGSTFKEEMYRERPISAPGAAENRN